MKVQYVKSANNHMIKFLTIDKFNVQKQDMPPIECFTSVELCAETCAVHQEEKETDFDC